MIDGRRSRWTVLGFVLMFVWPLCVGLYDALIIGNGIQSISNLTVNVSRNYPIVPVLFAFHAGILTGHLFCPQIVRRED